MMDEEQMSQTNNTTVAARVKYLADLLTRADKDTQGNVRKVLLRIEGSKKRKENTDAIANGPKIKNDDLYDTLAFLQGETMATSSETFIKEVRSLKKPGLVERVVRRVENLWPEYCSSCKADTSYQPDEPTELWCLMGSTPIGHNSKSHNPKGHNPKRPQLKRPLTQKATTSKGHNLKRPLPQKATTQKATNIVKCPKRPQPQKATTPKGHNSEGHCPKRPPTKGTQQKAPKNIQSDKISKYSKYPKYSKCPKSALFLGLSRS